jgi:ABC-type transporter Mla subunit MlaD
MRLIFFGPSDIVRFGLRTYSSLEEAMSLVPRLANLLSEVEVIVTQVRVLLSEVDETQRLARAVVEQADVVSVRAEGVVEQADSVSQRAGEVLAQTAPLAAQFTPLLERLAPTLQQLQPMLERLAKTTSPNEVDAVVALIDTLPELVGALRKDVLPIVATLGTVAPDLRDLLDVSKELNEILGSVPGLGRVKKRVEQLQAQQDEHQQNGYRAEEEPPAAPDRP